MPLLEIDPEAESPSAFEVLKELVSFVLSAEILKAKAADRSNRIIGDVRWVPC
jgi:hypothetical protein